MSALPVEEVTRTAALPSYLTRFVGRSADLADLYRRVLTGADASPPEGLIVLVGLGGVGKSRLMVELAGRLAEEAAFAERFPHGIWWVDLAPVLAPRSVPVAIASAAGLPLLDAVDPVPALIRALRRRRALVLMDNCEHLVEACQELWAALLPTCLGLVVVATSRVPVGRGAEIALAPLDTASPEIGTQRSEAAELFYDRAGMLLPGYPASASDEPAVAALCRRVGGLPLAIELAAPWMRTLSASDLVARIDRSLDLLASADDRLAERHRAMRAVLDGTWSWLSPDEQRVPRGLGILVGGFSLGAAEEVCGASLSVLSTLTERALIRRVPQEHDDTRFVMHEMVRQYTIDKLHELPDAEVDELRQRHLEHLVTCTERWEAARNGPDEHLWLARMYREEANIEVTLAWGLARGASELVLRLVAGMKNVWIYAGSVGRHHRAISAVLRQPWDATSPTATAARAHLLMMAAGVELEAGGTIEGARQFVLDSLVLNRQIGNIEQQTACLRYLCLIAFREGKYPAGERLARQSLDLCRRTGDDIGAAWSISHMAEAAFARNDHLATERHLIDSSTRFHLLNVGMAEGGMLTDLADLRRAQARWIDALDAYVRGLAIIRETAATGGIRNVLRGVAAVAVAIGQPETAAQLFGAADTWEQTYGGWDSPISRPPDAERATARAAVGEDAWSIAYHAGARLTPQQALAAVEQAIARLQADLGAPLPAGLTGREAEVIALLAEGLSNDDIATRLVVSPRTVHAHLRSIFRKLAVSTRTAAVREAGRLGLRL